MALYPPKSNPRSGGRESGAPRGDFVPCPAGPQQAVCCDVHDLGEETTTWDGEPRSQHKVRIYWQSAHQMPDGKPFLVQMKYTLSMGEKANLRKLCDAWRGRPFTNEEADKFDLEKLIGRNCYLNIGHNKRRLGGKVRVFADVLSIMPLPPGNPPLVVRDYERKAPIRPKRERWPPARAAAPPPREEEWDDPRPESYTDDPGPEDFDQRPEDDDPPKDDWS